MASGNGMLDVRRMGTVGRIVLGVVLLLVAVVPAPTRAAVTEIGSEGTAPGQFDIPSGVAAAADGSIYTLDWADERIQHLDANGNPIAQWQSTTYPLGVSVATNGDVYVMNVQNSSRDINYFSPTGTPLGSWTAPAGTSNCIASDSHDHMYTVGAGAITEYSETGQELATIPISGTQPGDECLAVTNTGGFVVTNDQHNTVSEYESNGAARASWSAFYAQGVAVGSRGQVFVGVGNGAAVEEFSESGVLEGRVPLRPPTAGFYTNYNKLALAPSGLLYSTDPRSNVIWRLDTTPHAEITASPAAGLASQQVTFDASGSSLDIGSIADYRWDLDGSGAYATDTGATATVSHRFDTPGTYAIGVQVTASDGETVQGALSYTVGGSSASFISSPSPGLSGQAVTFDASPSQIPNSSITDYAWDFDGSGSYSTDSGTSPTVSHAFSTSGTYTVQLKVTRAGGRIDTASGTIEIRPVPPVGAVGVSVNDGDYATNTTAVQLYVVWPVLASGALVSNDGGFGAAGGTTTLPLASTIPWTLRSEGSERLPKTVYVRFPDSGNPTQTFTDDIILDTTTPVVQSASSTGSATTASVAAAHRRSGRVFRIRIHATEKLSGVSAAQFSTTRSGGTTVVFTDRTHQGIQRFVRVVKVSMAKRPRYVRVRSAAGNWSKWHRIGG